jgi:spore germination protein KC
VNLKCLIGFFLCAFVLMGCWDQQELADISLVTGIALDKGKKAKFDLTVEVINSKELTTKTQAGNAPSLAFTLEGNTVSELAQKMNVGVSKRLIYSHMRTLVIDEKVAREGILDFLDFLDRNREIRGDFNLLVSRGVKAADVLKITYPFQKASTLKLHTQLQTFVQNWGGDPNVRLDDVIKTWTSPGREPVLEAVKVKGIPEKGGSVDNMKKVAPDAIVVADSLALFKKDKLKGFLSLEDIRNFLMTQNKLVHTAVSVPCAKNKFVGIRIFGSNTNTKVRMMKNRAVVHLKVDDEAYIDGMQCKDDLEQISTYMKIERLTEKEIKHQLAATIQKVQKKYQADIFGFGEVLHHQDYPSYKRVKKNWNNYFKDALVNIDVNVRIKRTGIRTKSLTSVGEH